MGLTHPYKTGLLGEGCSLLISSCETLPSSQCETWVFLIHLFTPNTIGLGTCIMWWMAQQGSKIDFDTMLGFGPNPSLRN